MTFLEHFQLMARYNQRMNRQVYAATANVPAPILERDLGAFFKSILGTLNHLLVTDLIWLDRISRHQRRYESLQKVSRYPKPDALNATLYSDHTELKMVREELDSLIVFWLAEEVKEADFARTFTYTNTRGISSTRNFGELVSHMFNHQTHHRGQLSTLLNQLGIEIGVTDFLVDIPDQTNA